LGRGVARNLLGGTKEWVWGTEVPSVVQGQSPGGGSRRHMLNIRLNKAIDDSTLFMTIYHRSSQIAYRVRLYFEKIPSYDGGMHPWPPLATPLLLGYDKM